MTGPARGLFRRLRRATTAGAAATAGGAVLVVALEALLATKRPYVDPDSAPEVTGLFGNLTDPAFRIVVLGDSTGAGSGVTQMRDTVGGQLADRLSRSGLRVLLEGVAISGSRCRDLGPQVSRGLLTHPDLAVIVIGANDALRGASLKAVRRDLGRAVGRLRHAGVLVVVGTCPDLGAATALAQPLRALAGWRGRAVARVQAEATLAAGGEPIDIGRITGPVFRADPGTLSEDLFHPAADGYRLWAEALHPAALAAARDRTSTH